MGNVGVHQKHFSRAEHTHHFMASLLPLCTASTMQMKIEILIDKLNDLGQLMSVTKH